MKKYMVLVSVLLGLMMFQAEAQSNAVYIGRVGGDGDFSNTNSWYAWPATNVPYQVQSVDNTFFRGDGVDVNPSVTNVFLSEPYTVSSLKFQKGGLQECPGAAYRFSGDALTLDGTLTSQSELISYISDTTEDQVFGCDVILKSYNNANNQHVKSSPLSGDLYFTGTLSQDSGSAGIGIHPYSGDIVIDGNVDGSGKLWKIHDKTGDGIIRFTGTGAWSNFGTVQVSTGARVLLARDTTDSTGFAPGVLQIQSGTLQLGNDEQILNALEVNFSAATGWLELDGYTETVQGLKFGNVAHTGTIDMGDGGVLRLSNQNSLNTWGALTITNWNEGVDHIYVDGGSFSSAQLAAITFSGQSAGAQVASGELLPASLVAIENNVYTGLAGDNNLNNDANWWNSLGDNDRIFFRGDNIASNPAWASPSFASPTTVAVVKFQDSPGASYTFSGSELTVNGATYGETILIDTVTSSYTQTFSNDVVLVSANNANNRHVTTSGDGTLVFAGTLSQGGSSAGLGIGLNNGDIEVSGDIDGSTKLWKLHNDGGTGIMKLIGSGTWSGAGTVQIANGAELLLARDAVDSTGFTPGVLQVLNGTLTLGNDEQILNALELAFSASDGVFNLAGNEETLTGLKFTGAYSDTVAMGDGGVLRLSNQSSTATWGTLTVTEWESGEDHIYVDGGSFSASQLAAITFDGYAAGAKVESGELLPDGAPLGFSGWIDDYSLTGGDEAADADPDGDGVKNLYEYGFGGDPTNAAVTGTLPTFEISGDVMTITHVERTSAASGISYSVQQTPELVSPAWTSVGVTLIGESADVDGFKTVTNQTSTVATEKFMRVLIQEQ